MTMRTDPEQKRARQGRQAALVIAATGVLWVGGNWAGGALGWSSRARGLIDLLALAGFAWALIATYRIWRARRNDEG